MYDISGKWMNNPDIKSFHSDNKIKEKYLDILQKKYESGGFAKSGLKEYGISVFDAIFFPEDKKSLFETELGLPKWLAHLEDQIGSRIPNSYGTDYPIKFLNAIPVGIHREKLQSVYHKFCVFILENVCKGTDDPLVSKEIADIISLHKKEEKNHGIWIIARHNCIGASYRISQLHPFDNDITRSTAISYYAAQAAGASPLPTVDHYSQNIVDMSAYSISMSNTPHDIGRFEKLIELLKEVGT